MLQAGDVVYSTHNNISYYSRSSNFYIGLVLYRKSGNMVKVLTLYADSAKNYNKHFPEENTLLKEFIAHPTVDLGMKIQDAFKHGIDTSITITNSHLQKLNGPIKKAFEEMSRLSGQEIPSDWVLRHNYSYQSHMFTSSKIPRSLL